MKFIKVSIYKHEGHSSSNGGPSSDHDFAYYPCKDGFLTRDKFEEGVPVLFTVERTIMGKTYVHATPEAGPADDQAKIGPMFGGCFVYSSDGRFPHPYPIPLHDRWESQELYDSMWR